MRTKLTTLIKQKFNIQNPHKLLRDLKSVGKIDSRSLRKAFEDVSPENFDIEIIKKYILYVSSKRNVRGFQYDPEYWMYRCNISYDEAICKVEKFKSDKATSKEGFLARHGEEKGLEMFKHFQKTSAYSTSDEWFKSKYNEDWKSMKTHYMKLKSRASVEYWKEKGFSLDDAKEKVSEHQRTKTGLYREFYRDKGLTEDEIDIILNDINVRKSYHNRNRKFLKQKYPDKWKELYDESSKKYRKRMEELGVWTEQSAIDEYKKYKDLVRAYTEESLLFYRNLVEDLELRSREYHLDHKYSIKMGFINGIDARIIGSVINLEILPNSLNCSKRQNCSISKKYLLTQYKKFQEEYENQIDPNNCRGSSNL